MDFEFQVQQQTEQITLWNQFDWIYAFPPLKLQQRIEVPKPHKTMGRHSVALPDLLSQGPILPSCYWVADLNGLTVEAQTLKDTDLPFFSYPYFLERSEMYPFYKYYHNNMVKGKTFLSQEILYGMNHVYMLVWPRSTLDIEYQQVQIWPK